VQILPKERLAVEGPSFGVCAARAVFRQGTTSVVPQVSQNQSGFSR